MVPLDAQDYLLGHKGSNSANQKLLSIGQFNNRIKKLIEDINNTSASEIKSTRFVWDSTIDGAITNPTTLFSIGTFGTAGKEIGMIRARVYCDGLNPNFVGGGAGTIDAYFGVIIAQAGGTFIYSGDGSGSDLTVDGWKVPTSGYQQDDTTTLGPGPLTAEINIDNPGGTWNLTGRLEYVVEWVENE